MSLLTPSVRALAVILGTSGAVHLARPETYEPIMPDFVPAQRQLILASGVAEILCAAGLLYPPTRRVAGWVSAALLVAVYPANLKMAGDAAHSEDRGAQAVAYGRLPLQIPLVWSAIKAARTPRVS